jgi:hypothetical protein
MKRLTDVETNTRLRAQWRRTKELGRARFLWRQLLFCLLFWLTLMLTFHWLIDRGSHPSLRSEIVIDLIVLPIVLLGGYVEGSWKWADLEKKIKRGYL